MSVEAGDLTPESRVGLLGYCGRQSGSFTVVLPDATPSTFAALRSCFSEPVANPGFQPDR